MKNLSIPGLREVRENFSGERRVVVKWFLSAVNAQIGTAAYSQHVLRS